MTSRREFLQAAGASLLTPFALASLDGRRIALAQAPSDDPAAAFGLSVASGDPSPTGVVLWTRINPDAWDVDTPLEFEVARDQGFLDVVVLGTVAAADFAADRDFTVHLDLDGHLEPNAFWFYRFRYGGVTSRTGRCRTLPLPDSAPTSLRLGVLTCQDFTNGYYPALSQLARDRVDYVLHLGDFIYETSGDPRFQPQPFPDRRFELPSGARAAIDLADYRFLYRTYRSDRHFQELLEAHTILCLWDDHETANDCYWDYARDTLGAPDHPLTKDHPDGGDPVQLRQLKRDAQQAWSEYVPARVVFDPLAEHPFDALRIYRRFQFGDLVDLFLTDERTYRSPPPCGVDERNLSCGCDQQSAVDQSMLGDDQRQWLIDGITSSTALWKVWANEVFLGELSLGRPPGPQLFLSLDAWDGYEAERQEILATIADAGVRNLVALTGDLHTYMASYLKLDYSRRWNFPGPNLVGVEFMTPAVTSTNLIDYLKRLLGLDLVAALTAEESKSRPRFLLENLVKSTNPHVHFFNSQEWGYSIVEFTRSSVYYAAFSVPKDQPGDNISRKMIRLIRVPVNQVCFQDIV